MQGKHAQDPHLVDEVPDEEFGPVDRERESGKTGPAVDGSNQRGQDIGHLAGGTVR